MAVIIANKFVRGFEQLAWKAIRNEGNIEQNSRMGKEQLKGGVNKETFMI